MDIVLGGYNAYIHNIRNSFYFISISYEYFFLRLLAKRATDRPYYDVCFISAPSANEFSTGSIEIFALLKQKKNQKLQESVSVVFLDPDAGEVIFRFPSRFPY